MQAISATQNHHVISETCLLKLFLQVYTKDSTIKFNCELHKQSCNYFIECSPLNNEEAVAVCLSLHTHTPSY